MVAKRLLAIIAALCAVHSLAGEVTVKPDRTTVFENESFNVEFSYSEEVAVEPGFGVLEKDFDIIAQNRRSNLQSFQGRFSYQLSWSLTLMPKRTGTLRLPPVSFNNDLSRVVDITVKPAPAGDDLTQLGDLSLEVAFTPAEGYVQGQFIYTQRLYHRGYLAGGDLSDPDFGDSDAVVRQLDQVKRYSLFRGGERYQVYEQSYLVFPQSSGTLRANPADFTGQLREPGKPPRLKRVSAGAAQVNVLGVPDGVSGTEFLPATSLTLEDVWPADVTFEQGRPVTRVLTITAKGLTAAQLPAIDIPDLDGLRVYADQPKREDALAQDGVTGTVEQSIALVPQRSGEMLLPAINVQWWDVAAKKTRTASLPARTINVASVNAPEGGMPQISVTGKPGVVTSGAQRMPAPERGMSIWMLTTFMFALAWLATLALWRRAAAAVPAAPRRRRGSERRKKRSLFAARAAVKRACDSADAFEASRALMDWARVIWPDNPPTSVPAMAERVDASVAEPMHALCQVLYGRDETWPAPDQLWRQIAAIKPRSDAEVASGQDPLAAL